MLHSQPPDPDPDDFSVRIRIRGDVLLIELRGPLTGPSVDMLQMYVLSTLATHIPPKAIMDIGGVTLVDEAGLGVLRAASGQARDAGGRMVIANGRRVLGMAADGFDHAPTISDAISRLDA
ncbi:hypothetical protein BKM31_19130 [[Actinomadura] parvosata subsp. kistnae]|uniref:STAS domain-containing protein n=1 Tax=[Actinomadura] parvosata subsp. kistnae TaxID=1909395 RepID=A0A1U9ZZC3_9ACTN|nr:STAS domain-containing protein [Nonomuraea sp. ATCC 55076]AQZ63295.1 hypothetical protein BKM31_19130 [Nonomuraea sp. ATCC 55076]